MAVFPIGHRQPLLSPMPHPANPISASVTRTAKGGSFLVNFSVSSTDPDGDTVSYEYQNMTADRYYPVGTHTVKVKAKDNYGGISDWASRDLQHFQLCADHSGDYQNAKWQQCGARNSSYHQGSFYRP